jgi:hypothetical protein
MRYRVYKDGNILFFENLDNGVLYTGTDSVVRIISNNPNNTSFTVSGTSPSFTGNPLSIDSLYKKNYSKYTNLEWINFYTTATNYTPDDEFNGTMDDIPNGSTYVKTENNFSDADKNKLDTINALTDGNKGDVTVSSSGSVFTINSNSVGDSEIIDVSANKVTQNSSRRFVTDADKTYWNAKEDASNKTDVAVGNETSSVKFLSVKGVVDWVTSLFTPKSRTLTINGDTKDLSANRSWTISTSTSWGGITGTLSSQTDLQTALDLKQNRNGYTDIIKSANQDVVNNGGTDDTELFFPVVSGGVYHVKFSFIFSCDNITADSRFYFRTASATMLGAGSLMTLNTAANIITNNVRSISNFSNTVSVGASTASLNDVMVVTGELVYHISANDTMRFVFGNNVATPGATTRLWAGSSVSYKKIN